MSTSTSAVFTGSSTYSSDFAQVIKRAQQIASLPISLLNNEKTTLTSQQTALGALGSSFTSLQASLLSMDSAMSSGNYGVTYSNSAVASATASTGALLGTYSLQVVDSGSLGSATSAVTGAATVTDPTKSNISSAFAFSLTANGQQYNNIVPTTNTLSGLADAINTATNGAVQATVVNMGSASAPSYQLSVQNTKYGSQPITLNDVNGGANLLANATPGTSVQYRVNGQPATGDPLSADTRTLT